MLAVADKGEPKKAKKKAVKKSSTIADVISSYISLQHKISVVNLLLKTIEPYVPSDSGGVSSIHHDRTCLNPVVSSEAFDEIWLRLRELKDEFEDEMNHLESVEVPVDHVDG